MENKTLELKSQAFDKIRYLESLNIEADKIRQEINQISAQIRDLEKQETTLKEK